MAAVTVNTWKGIELTDEDIEFGPQVSTPFGATHLMTYPYDTSYVTPLSIFNGEGYFYGDAIWATPNGNLIVVARRYYYMNSNFPPASIRYPGTPPGMTIGGDSDWVAWLVSPTGTILDKQYVNSHAYSSSVTVDPVTGTGFISAVTFFFSPVDPTYVWVSNALVSEVRGKLSVSANPPRAFHNGDVVFPLVQLAYGAPLEFDTAVPAGATPATVAPGVLDMENRMTISAEATNSGPWGTGRYFAHIANVIVWFAQDIDTGANLWYYVQTSDEFTDSTSISVHTLDMETPGTVRALQSAAGSADHQVWLQKVNYSRAGMSMGDRLRYSDVYPGGGGNYASQQLQLLRPLTFPAWGRLEGLALKLPDETIPGYQAGDVADLTASTFTTLTKQTRHGFPPDMNFGGYGPFTPFTGYNNAGVAVVGGTDAMYAGGFGTSDALGSTIGLFSADLIDNTITFSPVIDWPSKDVTAVASGRPACAIIGRRAYLTTSGNWMYYGDPPEFTSNNKFHYVMFMPGTAEGSPLRLKQRNDNLGISLHPRLFAGANLPNRPQSVQQPHAPRLPQNPNTYS